MLRKSNAACTDPGAVQAARGFADSDLPALPVLALDVLVRLRAVGGLHVGAVPFELLARAEGGDPDEDRLGEGAGVGEVAERLGAALARREPLEVVAAHAVEVARHAGHAGERLLDLQVLVADQRAVAPELPVAGLLVGHDDRALVADD